MAKQKKEAKQGVSLVLEGLEKKYGLERLEPTELTVVNTGSLQLNQAMGLPVNPVQLQAASLMHDVGMSFIPHNIFNKEAVIFKISDTQRKYHVPLLLNPFGFSTYRGS